MPPSIASTWPVTYEASSEARNATAVATSAGSARIKDEYYRSLPNGFPRDAWTFEHEIRPYAEKW